MPSLHQSIVALLFAALLPVSAHAVSATPATTNGQPANRQALELSDTARQRSIALALYFPANASTCSAARPCPVALISAGYGVGYQNYTFLASMLNQSGYLAVSVQHELATDPPLASSGDLVTIRTPVWRRGADNLRFVKASLSTTYPQYNWQELSLIGSSNGGDISAWLLNDTPDFASSLITLDHRRVALPRSSKIKTLSIRASDYPADPGVLPGPHEQHYACVVKIDGARHNDMHDGGPDALKDKIVQLIRDFIQNGKCAQQTGENQAAPDTGGNK